MPLKFDRVSSRFVAKSDPSKLPKKVPIPKNVPPPSVRVRIRRSSTFEGSDHTHHSRWRGKSSYDWHFSSPLLLPSLSLLSVRPFNRFDITMGEITDFGPH